MDFNHQHQNIVFSQNYFLNSSELAYLSQQSTSNKIMSDQTNKDKADNKTKNQNNMDIVLTEQQQLLFNTCKFYVIFELLRSYNTQLVNQALYLAGKMFLDEVLVVQTLNNNRQCYKCQVIDMLILVFAQLKCDDVLYTTLLEFVIKYIDHISPEILLSQFHSSLLFNLPICVFEWPQSENSNFVNNQEVINNYIILQQYIAQSDDEIAEFITYDNIYLQCVQFAQFRMQSQRLRAKDIYSVVTNQLQRRNHDFNTALLNNQKVIEQLKSWQQSEEGRYAVNMYKQGKQIQLFSSKNTKQQLRNQNNNVYYINPPQDVVDLFQAKKLDDEDAVNPMTTYTKASEYENLNILDHNQISIQMQSGKKNHDQNNNQEVTDAKDQAIEIENNLFYFLMPQRQNFFQLQTISSFICGIKILEKALNSQSLWQLKGKKLYFQRNHITYLVYEAYQYVISCLFTLHIDYAFLNSTLCTIFSENVQKQQFEYGKMLTNDPSSLESLVELSLSFKLRFFSDTNFLQLICIYLQMYSKQDNLRNMNIIYRILSSHAICETDKLFVGDLDKFLNSEIFTQVIQNICTIFITINCLSIDDQVKNQELIQFSFRPFVIEMLFSLKGKDVMQLMTSNNIAIIQKHMFEQISNVCAEVTHFNIFKQGWEFIHSGSQ